jgi:hypothetical protein
LFAIVFRHIYIVENPVLKKVGMGLLILCAILNIGLILSGLDGLRLAKV